MNGLISRAQSPVSGILWQDSTGSEGPINPAPKQNTIHGESCRGSHRLCRVENTGICRAVLGEDVIGFLILSGQILRLFFGVLDGKSEVFRS